MSAVIAFDAIEAMETFFPAIEFFEGGIVVQPLVNGEFRKMIEAVTVGCAT